MKRAFVEPPRVRIPVVCWIPEPGGTRRCTEREGHENPSHFHCYTREEWPRHEGEEQ